MQTRGTREHGEHAHSTQKFVTTSNIDSQEQEHCAKKECETQT